MIPVSSFFTRITKVLFPVDLSGSAMFCFRKNTAGRPLPVPVCSLHLPGFPACGGRYGTRLPASSRIRATSSFEVRQVLLIVHTHRPAHEQEMGGTGGRYLVGFIKPYVFVRDAVLKQRSFRNTRLVLMVRAGIWRSSCSYQTGRVGEHLKRFSLPFPLIILICTTEVCLIRLPLPYSVHTS